MTEKSFDREYYTVRVINHCTELYHSLSTNKSSDFIPLIHLSKEHQQFEDPIFANTSQYPIFLDTSEIQTKFKIPTALLKKISEEIKGKSLFSMRAWHQHRAIKQMFRRPRCLLYGLLILVFALWVFLFTYVFGMVKEDQEPIILIL